MVGGASRDADREEALLATTHDVAPQSAQAVDERGHGTLEQAVVAREGVKARGEGQQGHHETGHCAGIVTIVVIGMAAPELRQQGLEQLGVVGLG